MSVFKQFHDLITYIRLVIQSHVVFLRHVYDMSTTCLRHGYDMATTSTTCLRHLQHVYDIYDMSTTWLRHLRHATTCHDMLQHATTCYDSAAKMTLDMHPTAFEYNRRDNTLKLQDTSRCEVAFHCYWPLFQPS
jgi:hypothetical protein